MIKVNRTKTNIKVNGTDFCHRTFDLYDNNKILNEIIHIRKEVSCRGRPNHSGCFRFGVVPELLGEIHCENFSCQTEHIN